MHFTYVDVSDEGLAQGDILRRTSELDQILSEVHPHYADGKNEFFQVLTQSCDLVLRNDKCAARYIAIAPVRPVRLVLSRYLERFHSGIWADGHPILDSKQKSIIVAFAKRLLNNNEAKYFYLEPDPRAGITEGCCTFLSLSIALKSELHYSKLLDARILQLTENFRSKLGWMVGSLYSRVGTEDWDESKLIKAVNSRIDEADVVWTDAEQFKHLKLAVKDQLREAKNDGLQLQISSDELKKHFANYKKRKQLVVERVDELLQDFIHDHDEIWTKKQAIEKSLDELLSLAGQDGVQAVDIEAQKQTVVEGLNELGSMFPSQRKIVNKLNIDTMLTNYLKN